MNKKLIAFGYYGGKFSHLDWLLPLLPECYHYCEPFGGSCAVLINRKPSKIETYNDLEGEVVNFFRVLRDDKENLIEKILLTPFSREEFDLSCQLGVDLSNIERARRFYVKIRQVFGGIPNTCTTGRWASCVKTSRGNMSGAISRWIGGTEKLAIVAERLLRVQIENRPAIEVIKKYDSDGTFFYCDPPYIHRTRVDISSYSFEMSDIEHAELANVLNSVKGRVAFSNYDCEFLDELYPGTKWKKYYSNKKTSHFNKSQRVEVLWVNYDVGKNKCRETMNLFE